MSHSQYRMIAIDLDGTLLSPAGAVTARTKAAIHGALSAGLLVCFATGRNWTESQVILDAVAHYDTAVFVGGAMVIDTKRRITLHRTKMSPGMAREVCQVLEELGHAALALQDTHEAGVDYLITDQVELNPATRIWMESFNMTIRKVPCLGDYAHPHTVRVGICAPYEVTAHVQGLLRAKFGERVMCQCLHVPAAQCEVLETFEPGVNKWQAVQYVAQRHGIASEQIIAIGDDVNDVLMIKNAGLGVAMGNAKAEVRAVAKRVIRPNTEDGLAEFLEELVGQHVVEPLDSDGTDAAA